MGREYSLSRLKKLHIGIIKEMTKQLEANTVHAKGLAVRMTALKSALVNLEVIKQLEAGRVKPLSVFEVDNILDKARQKAARMKGQVVS